MFLSRRIGDHGPKIFLGRAAVSVNQSFQLAEVIASGRLALHYQPRVHSVTKQIIGAEALLRWCPNGDSWESVSALSQFDAADFAQLWSWKLRQLARAFAWLGDAGGGTPPKFFISLNLSYKQLHSDLWAHEVLDWLVQTRLPGTCLEIELTEEGGVQDKDATVSAFERLRATGVSIALDDFPEGGLSLLRLAHFSFDKVKIDRAMVPQMSDDRTIWVRKRQLLSDLIALITRQGSIAVVEGIEQEPQLSFLSGLDVTEWQGFLWGKATPIDQLFTLPGTNGHNVAGSISSSRRR